MRSRTLILLAGRSAAVLAVLLLCAGLASAGGVRLATLPGSAAAVSPPATPAPSSVGGTPSPNPRVNPIIRRRRPISASPATRKIRPGAKTTFTIRLQPSRTVRSYRLKLWRAPKNVTLRINRKRARTRATITVRTTAKIRLGRYTLRLSAWPRRRRGTRRPYPKVLRAKMTLVVAVPAPAVPKATPVPPGKLYAAGDVADPLTPGVARPVYMVVTNGLGSPVDVTAISATVTGVTPAPGGACTAAEFTTVPASLPAPLRVAAETSATLAALGLPRSAWPAVMMVDRPVSQDGCKGATVTLRFDVQGRQPG